MNEQLFRLCMDGWMSPEFFEVLRYAKMLADQRMKEIRHATGW